jgi:ABC-type phosphate/phosphonate transport system substrate-binding protein
VLIASSRMYNVVPQVRSLWDGLFGWLSRSSGVELELVAHEAPAPLSALWQRRDLGAAFMCGYPFITTEPDLRPVALAAPVARADWAQGRPLYASHIVAASGSPITAPDDLRGATLGWTVRDSQSGYHALRRFLVDTFPADAGNIFGATKGPFLNPVGMIEAVIGGVVDAGPVDAYAFDLLRMHAPAMVSGVKILATTGSTPCPLLVASRQAPGRSVEALRRSLLTAHEDADGLDCLESLGLLGFAEVVVDDYPTLVRSARLAEEQGLGEW